MSGRTIPAPLAMPPTTKPSPAAIACFGTESVVMIPRAAFVSAAGPRSRAAMASAMPSATRSMGRRLPMVPVEQTSTSAGSHPSPAATSSVILLASARPSSPVPALAPPELITTARIAAAASRRSRDTCTGAAGKRFTVNMAAATAGVSATTSVRSWAPEALMPPATPAAVKPKGEVTLMASIHRAGGPLPRGARGRGWRTAPPARRLP